MEDHSTTSSFFVLAIAFLSAAIVFVPLFKRAGLGSVLGYLFAGMVLNLPGLDLVEHPEEILHFAEFGVVLLLFLIGLELNPSRLWAMRRDIFGLGALQIVACTAVLMLYPLIVGRPWTVSLVAGLGLALSSTALVMQIIEERNAMRLPYGQKTFAVLLMQDIAIVPLLVIITLLAPGGEDDMSPGNVAASIALALAAVGVVIAIGQYALNPIFRILARYGGSEIMTGAALLVVIAAGTAMVSVGLSMATGAFIAGVLLAESNYRNELEADIEPFRGLLLGLFFISVGLSIDLGLVYDNLGLIAGFVGSLLLLKGVVIYVLVRLFSGDHRTGVKSGILLSQGGEFGFVLFTAAATQGVVTAEDASLLSVTVILSMISTPILIRILPPLLIPAAPAPKEPKETFDGADGEVLIIGFGRFGQLVSQMLLAGGYVPTLLDADPDRVREAQRFGTRVYYGDGTRLDVLRAAGAERCKLIAVCTTPADVTTRIVDHVHKAFPQAQIFARSYDRRHALLLADHQVDYERRETFDSALRFGRDALVSLGMTANEAKESEITVRRRDRERMEYQRIEGITEGHRKWKEVTPEPLTKRVDAEHPDDRAEAAE
ncbi:MAG: monovalent cation:proton antiporter-2 (CPA2) family protein [Pseudomonadota bacterium]